MENLEEIERLASLYYKPEEIAVILGFNPELFKMQVCSELESEQSKAFWRGYYATDQKIREMMRNAAIEGDFDSLKQILSIRPKITL